MKKRQRKPRWWQYVIAYAILRPIAIIVGLILFFCTELFLRSFGRKIVNFFENHPHEWYTEEDVTNAVTQPEIAVMIAVTYLHTVGFLEHRLSEKLMDEWNMSELRRREAYEREQKGPQHSFNGHLYEYRLHHQPGARRKLRDYLSVGHLKPAHAPT